jgi:hypothetical protein
MLSRTYFDITYILYLRRKPESYVNRILIPSLAITVLSLIALMMPTTSPSTRFIFLFILMSYTTSVDLPEGCIIANLLSWCHIIKFSVLIYSIIVTALTNSRFIKSKTVISSFFRSIISCVVSEGMDICRLYNKEQIRWENVKILDILSLTFIFCSDLPILAFGSLSIISRLRIVPQFSKITGLPHKS